MIRFVLIAALFWLSQADRSWAQDQAAGKEPSPRSELSCEPHTIRLLYAFRDRVPPDLPPEDLETTLSTALSIDYLNCGYAHLIAAAMFEKGIGVAEDRDRAQALFRKIALFAYVMDTFESVIVSSEKRYHVTDQLFQALTWVESLETLTAEQVLAAARRHAPLDAELAGGLELLAARSGSKAAMRSVGRRAFATGIPTNEALRFAYMRRAVAAGADDLTPDLAALKLRLGAEIDMAERHLEKLDTNALKFRHELLLWR